MAFRFRKNCERSDTILQRFLDPTEETLDDEFEEQAGDTSRSSKDSRVLVSSDGLYEYRPPVGLNVKLVKGETGGRVHRNKKGTDEHTIYLKSEPMDEETLEENDGIDVFYDIDTNFDDSTDAEKTSDSIRKVITKTSNGETSISSENDSKIMQIKPVRTNKVRLGYTSASKSKPAASSTVKTKTNDNTIKDIPTTSRSPKSKTNSKGEPKQPKKCEICGNTYMYQHALER